MSRIHPTTNKCQDLSLKGASSGVDINNAGDDAVSTNPSCPSAVLTVWKRSSMTFQGTDGFTVFDQHGRLAFRVDNYSRKKGHVKGGLVLMDGAGKALLTLKPQEQILNMQYQWNGYKGEGGCGKSLSSSKVLFSMRRRSGLIQSKQEEAEVFMGGAKKQRTTPDFRIEGSFMRRNCKIRSAVTGELVAKIARKKVNTTVLLADDVFSLAVQPGFDSQLIMAFVMILDRICVKPFTPFLCS
ncbi:protein LURP-one-related 5-like [Vitis riparia]|uniref:protein LURP-one-related 5-like n=1 Tax=Vitis riparia TaxID=96939 RepID=UPI00155A255D|nr:protein LURP-one-related 5-like [Vitis riparia]